MSDHSLNDVEYTAEARYEPCLMFEDNRIPYVIWSEAALAQYGVPTVGFDLWILVLDLGIAANCLIKAGCTVDTISRR